MQTFSSLAHLVKPTCVALGNFDGIHLGHLAVIQSLFPDEPDDSRNSGISPGAGNVQVKPNHPAPPVAANGLSGAKTVVSFSPHPQVFFSGQPKPLLTLKEEKVSLLAQAGVDQLVLLPFTQTLAALSPADFVEQVLIQQLQAHRISVGFNFCFGYQRSGTAQDLQAIAAQFDVPVVIVPPKTVGDEQVSSSAIREALSTGDVDRSCRLLGRPYALTGQVVVGQKLGRTLGFPTANLAVSGDKFLPRRGVYAVTVKSSSLDSPRLGVVNIGCRPTVNGQQETIEVHVLDWSGDLYGHTVTIELVQFLRPEQKFASMDALKAQIMQDCDRVRSRFVSVG